jgi:hypothetical protein
MLTTFVWHLLQFWQAKWGLGERWQAVIDGWPQRIRGGYDSDEDSYEWDA